VGVGIVAFDRIVRLFRRSRVSDLNRFKTLFDKFQQILTGNNRVLELMSEIEDKLSGEYIFDINYLKDITERLSAEVYLIVSNLNVITDNHYQELFSRQALIQEELENIVQGRTVPADQDYAIDYERINTDVLEIVGGKNATLGEIKNHLNMTTPDGFVVTATAYRRFMEHNDLWPRIRDLHKAFKEGREQSPGGYDREVESLFESASIPQDLARSISRHLGSLRRRHKDGAGFAVRSSAFGEDDPRQSYAGQFKSFLNCPDDEVLEAYKGVIASRFKNAVAVYAGERILDEAALPMAVGIQQTIAASAAGVLYSVDPSGGFIDSIAISASFGLGANVVEGTTMADYFRVSRLDPTDILDRRIGTKETKLVPAGGRGVVTAPVTNDFQRQASLSDDQVIELAKTALLLDRYFRRPVDVEWCFDSSGKLYVLQCRPLRLPPKPKVRAADLRTALANATVIMREKGLVAQRGIAAGKVWHVDEDDDPRDFPVGAIAVTKYTAPRLTSIIRRAAAIIADVGSSGGHMATVAREFGVPMIVNTGDATQLLADGDEVTVDAEENVVFRGVVNELLEYEMEAEDVFRDLKEYHILRRLIRRVSPLSLIDPSSPDFTARNCRTYHDIVRFSHEKAVLRLMNLSVSSSRFRGVESRKIRLPVPLGLSVIDLGGGLTVDAGTGDIDSPDRIQSLPMKAILKGLTSPGVWSTQPTQLGFGDLVSSLTRYTMTDRATEYQGQNLAVISNRYANISLRLGYHFNVIDTYVSNNVNDNYIYFRFVGGVTETDRRRLRAILIKEILEKLNFKASATGDLVVARLKGREADEVLRVLEEIGRLIGFTRQLDTQMYSEESVQECLRVFFEPRRESGD
jgi:pyruvate,water dikinase